MIKIKPVIQHTVICPYCGGEAVSSRVLWQGIHVAVVASCSVCHVETVTDLPIGQAIFTPYQINTATGEVFGNEDALNWFGRPFLESLCKPDSLYPVVIQIEKRREISDAVIINCLDYLYGHSLLKLLNSDSHRETDRQVGLVVLIPSFLRWMVPKYVAEVWVVNIPLSKSQSYFPLLHAEIEKQLIRFNEVYLSLAHSHPSHFDIINFTGEKPCRLDVPVSLIAFIWREDRIWAGRWAVKLLKMFGLDLYWQNNKVTRLFKLLKGSIPEAEFVVVGLGKATHFPKWIRDARVESFDEHSERTMCRIYSESKLVIGVHGSNMLLPSAHAWATIDIMPDERWPNLAQDILYQGSNDDIRITSWRYRFLPLKTSVRQVALIARATLLFAKIALKQFEQSIKGT